MQDELYNLPFERSVLCSILFEPKMHEENELLNKEDFYLPAHQNIYFAMSNLVKRGLPIDEEFIKKELIKEKCFDEQVMLEIMSANPISNIDAYINEVKEFSKLRKLLSITTTIKKCVIEDGISSAETIMEVEKQIMLLDKDSSTTMPIDMNVAIENYKNMIIPPLVKMEVPSVDELLCGGIESAQLVHVGGESGIGKTTWTRQVLKNVCEHSEVLFFSFEMPYWKMARDLEKRNFKRESYHIIDSNMMSTDVSDVVRMLRRMRAKKGIRFALIDSDIELSNNHFKGQSDVERKGDKDKQLARVANELDIVIFLITQISDANIQSGRMKSYGSTLSDYATDMKILLLKGDNSDITLSIEKARQDAQLHKKIPLWFDHKNKEFTDRRVVETVYDSTPLYNQSPYEHPSYEQPSYEQSSDKIEITLL